MSEEAFSERVKKTFGNLLASVSPTPTPSSLSNPLWSLTGTQIEKREWRRDKDTSDRDNNPCASSFDEFVSSARKNSRKNLRSYKKEFDDDDHMEGLDDDVDDDEGDDGVRGKGGDLDDWDLRGSIGLDSTLDNEEEEDAYDKVAIGRENACDRLYMSVIANNNAENFVSPNDLSPDSGHRRRDPRANRLAARIRLKEDDAQVEADAGQHKTAPTPENAKKESAGEGNKVKPILKRKEQESTSKPPKRVRFDPEYVNEGSATLSGGKNSSDSTTPVNQSELNERISRVPDYVQNSSKYTCYSLDSTDKMNDKSNTGSCLNVGSRSEKEDALADLPKSIAFVPKKKSNSAKVDGVTCESSIDGDSNLKHSSTQSTLVTGFVEEDTLETKDRDMEVDEPETSAELGITSRKQDRQYRTKSQAEEP